MEFTTWPSAIAFTPPPGLEHLIEEDVTETSVEITTSTFENDDTPPPVLKDVLEDGKEEDRCIICMEVPRKFAFLPCGHLVACSGCAKLFKPGGQCCMCRREIKDIIEIFK